VLSVVIRQTTIECGREASFLNDHRQPGLPGHFRAGSSAHVQSSLRFTGWSRHRATPTTDDLKAVDPASFRAFRLAKSRLPGAPRLPTRRMHIGYPDRIAAIPLGRSRMASAPHRWRRLGLRGAALPGRLSCGSNLRLGFASMKRQRWLHVMVTGVANELLKPRSAPARDVRRRPASMLLASPPRHLRSGGGCAALSIERS